LKKVELKEREKAVYQKVNKNDIEKLNREYSLFSKDQIISNETAKNKLYCYRESRVFQAGTVSKSIQTEQNPIENINSLKISV
jgi:hypothetical protein